jgi:hypothetical protein
VQSCVVRRVLLVWIFVAPSLRGANPPPFGPAGAEFRVSTSTTGDATVPALAFDTAGEFMVVWKSFGIYAQRFSAAGSPIGDGFHVNTYTTVNQESPRVAGSSLGRFVIVWTTRGYAYSYGGGYGLFVRRYDSSGPVGLEFRVRASTTIAVSAADVAADASGNFVVVWGEKDSSAAGSEPGIFARRYADDGSPLGGSFRVNTYTTGYQAAAAVAVQSSGDFVVVWKTDKQFGSFYNIVGQRYAVGGAPVGGEFLINGNTGETHSSPSVSALDTGFVVVWVSATGLFARRYDASGAPLTSPFHVNSSTTSTSSSPSISASSTGFNVAWSGGGTEGDGDLTGVYARRYAITGEPLGGEFLVNTYTTRFEQESRIASAPNGDFVVAWWRGSDILGSSYNIYAQRYCRGLAGDADGNGVIGLSDVFYVINNLFAGGPPPMNGADVNGDTNVDVSDVFYLINYLFASGPAPVCVPAA